MKHRVKIRIKNSNYKHIIEKLYSEKINLYDINITKEKIELIIDEIDLEKIDKMKTIKYKIIDYFGASKIKIMIKKYKTLIICLLIGIIINLLLSNIIFEIKVDTPNYALEKEIENELKNLGLKKYNFVLTRSKENEIKNKLLNKKKDKIEWLEIERIGTKYIVTIEEKKKTKEEICPIRNIISKKNAMITKIESSSGEIIKKKYDYVEKGEVIISGNIYKKEDIVESICAKGKVLGEVWYKVTVSFPYKTEKIKKNNNIYLQLSLNSKKIPNKDLGIVKQEFNIIRSSTNLYDIKLNIVEGAKKIVKNYSINNIDKEAIKEAEKDLEQRLSMKPIVKRKKVLKKSVKKSKILVEVFFAVEEDITDYQDIINEEG